MRLGRVAQISPLLVRLNGDLTTTSAIPMDDFSTATVDVTEVVVESIENRRFAFLAEPSGGGGGGGGGGATPHQVNFSTPAATWTVVHSLGRRPIVQLYDASDQQIDADVEYPDVNTVVVTHASPLSGAVLYL